MKKRGVTDEERLELLRRALNGQTVSQAARDLGVTRRTVYRWMAEFGFIRTHSTARLLDAE